MRVKPDDLLIALEVLGLIPSGSERQFYWNAYHRLEAESESLLMKTTDGTRWIEWRVQIEGTGPTLGVNVERDRLAQMKYLLPGGKLSLLQDQENKILSIERKPTLQMKMPYEQPSTPYPMPAESKEAVTWKFQSKPLAKALEFARHFIQQKGNALHACATLYADGTLITGSPEMMAVVQKLSPEQAGDASVEYISINATEAKLAARFLDYVGPNVEMLISKNTQIFRDPVSGNSLVLPGTSARFAKEPEALAKMKWTERSAVDSKSLYLAAKTFSGISSPQTPATLALEFRGEEENASLTVRTNEQRDAHRCSYEFSIHRTIHDGRPVAMNTMFVRSDLLIDAVTAIEGTSVWIDIGTRMLRVTAQEGDIVPSLLVSTPRQQKLAGGAEEIVAEHTQPIPSQETEKVEEK